MESELRSKYETEGLSPEEIDQKLIQGRNQLETTAKERIALVCSKIMENPEAMVKIKRK
jgi:hypothetical protein